MEFIILIILICLLIEPIGLFFGLFKNEGKKYNYNSNGGNGVDSECLKTKIAKGGKEIKIATKNKEILKKYLELTIESDISIKFNYTNNGGVRSLRTLKLSKVKDTDGVDFLYFEAFCPLREGREITFRTDKMTNLIINPKNIENKYFSELANKTNTIIL